MLIKQSLYCLHNFPWIIQVWTTDNVILGTLTYNVGGSNRQVQNHYLKEVQRKSQNNFYSKAKQVKICRKLRHGDWSDQLTPLAPRQSMFFITVNHPHHNRLCRSYSEIKRSKRSDKTYFRLSENSVLVFRSNFLESTRNLILRSYQRILIKTLLNFIHVCTNPSKLAKDLLQ